MASSRRMRDRSHMTSSMRMEEDQSHMTETILKLTLEIIYLLTGERCSFLKSGNKFIIKVLPSASSKPERPNKQKVLEATKKMMELLTGENDYEFEVKKEMEVEESSRYKNLPERCPRPVYSHQDPTKELFKDFKIVVKEEEEEYEVMEELSGRQKDVMEPPSNKNPRKRGFHSHWDSTEEGQCIPHDKQSANLSDRKLGVIKEEDEEMEESSSFSNPPERCTRPLYSHRNPKQGENLRDPKDGGDVEEVNVRDDQQYTEEEEEAGIRRTFIEEDTPTHISTDCEVEDKDITQYNPGENSVTRDVHPEPGSVSGPSYSLEEPHIVREDKGLQTDKMIICSECGKCATNADFKGPQLSHTNGNHYPCSECGKCFSHKFQLSEHLKFHIELNPYLCSQCDKCFATQKDFDRHQASHTSVKPFACSECGKCYVKKSMLIIHHRTHTGEKPFACSECGKSFARKSGLSEHQRSHTGVKPYPCSQCGKCFATNKDLARHQTSHTDKKPFSCSECGKSFRRKSHLSRHQSSHTGEKPYSCPECGKCYTSKYNLAGHMRAHRDEKPFGCSECGRFFRRKSHLMRHEITHTGEKPFSCNECGKSYASKYSLYAHQRSHLVGEDDLLN